MFAPSVKDCSKNRGCLTAVLRIRRGLLKDLTVLNPSAYRYNQWLTFSDNPENNRVDVTEMGDPTS
jgi:hypothetical protein